MTVKLYAIAALGPHREIGLNGHLPWSLADEYEHYKKTVKGHYVLVGRKNFEANQGDVNGAYPIVMSRTSFHHPNAFSVSSLAELEEFSETKGIKEIFVIGGSEIYDLTLPYLSEFYCSIVDYSGPADTYFPEYMFYEWEMIKEDIHEKWTFYHMKKRPLPLPRN
jgi:dihydrofolate reductase